MLLHTVHGAAIGWILLRLMPKCRKEKETNGALLHGTVENTKLNKYVIKKNGVQQIFNTWLVKMLFNEELEQK